MKFLFILCFLFSLSCFATQIELSPDMTVEIPKPIEILCTIPDHGGSCWAETVEIVVRDPRFARLAVKNSTLDGPMVILPLKNSRSQFFLTHQSDTQPCNRYCVRGRTGNNKLVFYLFDDSNFSVANTLVDLTITVIDVY
jgi:hypothetical protein